MPPRGELLGHELGVADRDAEGQGALLALSRQWRRAWRARPRVASLLDKLVRVEAAIAPGDLLVVDRLVIDAVVVEGASSPASIPSNRLRV